MAELAREGGVVGCPTEISECFCNLEEGGREAVPAAGSTSSRRKLRGGTGSMLLHLTPKQLLVARKPTLMDDLITRNRTALLKNKMERTRGVKNKRSDVDSEPEVPLSVKRLRSNPPDPVDIKRSRPRKRDSDDRKVRVTTRHFMSSLRSGKKRTHLKESALLVRKRKTLKSLGSRSNDSETDTPSSNSSTKANGHSVTKDKREDKTERNTSQFSKAKSTIEGKPTGSQADIKETITKRIRKKRRKVDSMVWLKKPNRAKHHVESKPVTEVVVKTEPLLSQSEPEDSGLGSEVKLDLGKVEDSLDENKSHVGSLSYIDNSSELRPSDSGIVSSNNGKPVWNIVPFQDSPPKKIPMNESIRSVNESLTEENEERPKQDLILSQSKNLTPDPDNSREEELEEPTLEQLTEASETVQDACYSVSPCNNLELTISKDLSSSSNIDVSKDISAPSTLPQDSLKFSPDSPELVNSEISLGDDNSSLLVESEEKCEFIGNEPFNKESADNQLNDTIDTFPSSNCRITNVISLGSSAMFDDQNESCIYEDEMTNVDPADITSETIDSTKEEITSERLDSDSADLKIEEVPQSSVEGKESDETSVVKSGDSEEKSEETLTVVTADSSTLIIEETITVEETLTIDSSSELNVVETLKQSDETVTDDQAVDVINMKEPCNVFEIDANANSCKVGHVNASEVDGNSENSDIDHKNGEIESINGCNDVCSEELKEVKEEEGVERQALKVDLLKALGLQSLRPMPPRPQEDIASKEVKDEKPSKLTEPGYTGTLKAVIKLNKGAPRSIVFKNDDSKPEYQICSEAASGVPISHLVDVSNSKKSKEVEAEFVDTVSNSSCTTSLAPQSDSACESEEDKPHGKESNLIIPEKSSSFSIHPGRLCCDVCCYCFGKFGSLDTPCHIAQLKGEERQSKILQNEPYLTVDSCLCDACYRYVDRKANCPSSAAAKTAKRARPPAATLCCVTDCTLPATHSVKRKWLLKIKRSLANKFEIDTEKHSTVFNPLCSNHHYWVDYYMVCGICRKRLNRNHLYTLGPETDRLNLVLAEDGIPARLSDKLFLCKLCRYYASMRLKYSDPTTIPQSSQPFYVNYRKKILASLDVPVSDSDEEKPKNKEGKDEDVMSLSGLATLLSDQPDPSQPRIQVKFGNVNIGTLSNLNIGQGRQEERQAYDRSESSNLPLNAAFDFQGPSTSDGSWEKVTSTLQFDKKTKQLWQDLQRPYGNQSSFLRHLVMLEKYWRNGYLVLSETADPRAAKYINSVQTRNKSFEGKSEVKELKAETPPLPPIESTPPPQEPILKVPDISKRFVEDPQKLQAMEQTKQSLTPQPFCPIIPTGEVEVLPVNPNKPPPKERQVSKGTLIIQRPVSTQSQPTPNPCKIMITNVQSLAKPKVDPVLLNRAKSLVRMVSPGVSKPPRAPLPLSIQRLPRSTLVTRPRLHTPQQYQQPYQALQAQLQAPLQQSAPNRYPPPPPPLVKINNQQQAMCQQQQQQQQRSAHTPRPQASTSSPIMLHQLQQQPINLQQQLHPSLSLLHSQQLQPSVSLIQHQPMVTLLQQQQPAIRLQLQGQSVSIMQNPSSQQVTIAKAGPPPPYPMKSILPRLPPSLSISTTPQQPTIPSTTPSVSLLPPSSSPGSHTLVSLPPISTLTGSPSHLSFPPPYSTSPCIIPSSITLPSSGITIEKQPHNFHSPPILPQEKPIISVFREPLPSADT